jgi:hypothetical protein
MFTPLEDLLEDGLVDLKKEVGLICKRMARWR